MNLATSSTTPLQGLTLTQRAELACQQAKQLEDAGEYEQAHEALREFWPETDEPPIVEGLDSATSAEVLLRVGALAGWLGSAHQATGGQETAKNLITRSIEIFEQFGESERVAEAQTDLALCYWREGSFDEAHDILLEVLSHLKETDRKLKAITLIRLGTVEIAMRRSTEALRLYYEAAPLLEESRDHALQGTLHNHFAVLFNNLGTAENREDYIDTALIEYAAASFHFEQAKNTRYQASVENNLGFLFFTLEKFSEAHEHLNRAGNLFLQIGDQVHLAQVNETRARVFLAEGHFKNAERVVRSAIKTLEKGGEYALLAEAVNTYGIVMARLRDHSRSKALLQRAIEVAETCGDLEGAGRARLSIIEELSQQTSAQELASIFQSAADLLQHSQDPSAGRRLASCASKTIEALLAEIRKQASGVGEESWEGFSLRREIRKIESVFIERALRDAGGSVSKAGRLLGFKHHQSLISILNSRQSDLQNRRSIIRKRRQHLFSEPRRSKGKTISKSPAGPRSQISILHVEDHKLVARLIGNILAAEGIHVETCVSGLTAWEILKTDAPYNALIVDNNLPGLSGLELVLRVRSMSQRRNIPIIMLSSDDCEKEAWRAGVDAFLRKPEAIDQLSSTIVRVLEERRKT